MQIRDIGEAFELVAQMAAIFSRFLSTSKLNIDIVGQWAARKEYAERLG
jgi:hypothetical protein